MNTKAVVCVLMSISLSTGGVAFAEGNRDRNDRGRGEQTQRDEQPNRHENQRHSNDGSRRDERGAGPNHAFYRGDRLPVEYRHNSYVVDDWRSHRLSAPPRGYHWVQTGGDYVLVAIATGIILQLLLNN
ncbi:MAG: RcnB family protein [Proteobacteria bacterium]|nr:RcnB family protein [Pseudomonadota bacterium]